MDKKQGTHTHTHKQEMKSQKLIALFISLRLFVYVV